MFCGLGTDALLKISVNPGSVLDRGGLTGQGSTVQVQGSTSLEVSGRGIAIGRHHASG